MIIPHSRLSRTFRIHGIGIFPYIWLILLVNVGKYTIYDIWIIWIVWGNEFDEASTLHMK